MKDLNWPLAIKRAYYVLWGLLVVLGVFESIDLAFNPKRSSDRDVLLVMPIVLWLIPYGILKSSQWIYAGLQSKQQ